MDLAIGTDRGVRYGESWTPQRTLDQLTTDGYYSSINFKLSLSARDREPSYCRFLEFRSLVDKTRFTKPMEFHENQSAFVKPLGPGLWKPVDTNRFSYGVDQKLIIGFIGFLSDFDKPVRSGFYYKIEKLNSRWDVK